MTDTPLTLDPRAVLTPAIAVRTGALFTVPAILSLGTEGRFVALSLLTAFISLGVLSIRRSVAEGNRSTTENVIVASLLITGAIAWGYFIAGPAFAAVPVAAVVATRGSRRPKAPVIATDAEPALVHH